MKKIGLLLIMILFLSGCDVEYNATITKDNVRENVILNGVINENFPTPAYINDQGASITNDKNPEIEYYDIINEQNATTFNFNYPLTRYHESTSINTCYKTVNIMEDNNSYKLVTNNYNSCLEFYENLEKITINLTFTQDFEISSNNADKINNNTYTWIIDKSNYDNKSIEITYSLKENNIDNKKNNNLNLLMIFSCFSVLIIVLTIVIKFKNKKLKG